MNSQFLNGNIYSFNSYLIDSNNNKYQIYLYSTNYFISLYNSPNTQNLTINPIIFSVNTNNPFMISTNNYNFDCYSTQILLQNLNYNQSFKCLNILNGNLIFNSNLISTFFSLFPGFLYLLIFLGYLFSNLFSLSISNNNGSNYDLITNIYQFISILFFK
jgi:hypothetical protein